MEPLVAGTAHGWRAQDRIVVLAMEPNPVGATADRALLRHGNAPCRDKPSGNLPVLDALYRREAQIGQCHGPAPRQEAPRGLRTRRA